jgi:hypothetical protein
MPFDYDLTEMEYMGERSASLVFLMQKNFDKIKLP